MKSDSNNENLISFNEIDTHTDLNFLGLLCVSGPDAAKFLQGQLTCNMDKISPTISSLAAHCNPQGRILSLSLLYQEEDAYYLLMPKEILTSAMLALQKYAVFFKAKLSDASAEKPRHSYRGPRIEQHLLTFFPTLPTNAYTGLLWQDHYIIKLPDVVPHYLVLGDNTALTQESLHLGSENTWKHSLIASGIPSLYATTTGQLLPHELNLHLTQAISFDKGCYTGQEIIARMHYRGQLKKHLYRARITSPHSPQPGDAVYHQQPSGIIVESCHIQGNRYEVLLMTNQAYAENQQLFLDPAETLPVEFLTLPYAL